MTQSLAASPDNRLLSRANSALTAGFASFPRAFASVASTSPPGRKRPSPGETFLANLAPTNITWGASTILGPTSEPAGTAAGTARNSYSDDDNVRNDDSLPLVCYGISTDMEDQTIFDDDGWLGVPFLEPSRHATYASYRHAYAEMLQMWNQPLARLEILKFNVLKEDAPDPRAATSFASSGAASYHDSYHSAENLSHSPSHHGANSPIVLGKKELLQSLITSDRGIDVTGICRIHEIHLDPVRQTHASATFGGAVGTCDRCKRTQMQLLCVFCNEPIDALYPPCLSCGCASHEACMAEWHAAGETECPAGDECNCVEEASNGEVESWAVMIGAISQGKIRKPSDVTDEARHVADKDKRGSIDKYDWEKIAMPHHSDGQYKAQDHHQPVQNPMSAARISLGNKLRKSAGAWGSTTSLRKKSGSGSGSGIRR